MNALAGGFMLRRVLSGIMFCVLIGTLSAHAGQFLEAPQYPTGSTPQAAATGDFNGDGNLDLAITNATSNTISVLLGKGDGTFAAKVDYATGITPQGVAVGDFNGDGHLDIAVTNSGSNTVSVFLGNGDGTFQPKVDSATGNKPVGIAVGDFNQDGNLDVVVTNATDGTIGVLLGTGNGKFNVPVAYNTGFNPYSVAVGHIYKNGNLDLAVANKNNSHVISVLKGNGDGTFQGQIQSVVVGIPISIALADFNNDGNMDIAVAEQFDPLTSLGNSVSILLGNGNGTFSAHVEYPTASSPTAVTVGDFNNDNSPDLGISDSGGNAISVYWGKGDGTFYGQLDVGTGDLPYSAVAADFNNDGYTDLIAANSGSNTISVILSNGKSRTFQARSDYAAGPIPASDTVGPNPYSVATSDFNGDGFPDLAVAASNCPASPPACGVAIILGNGDGTFQPPTQYSTGNSTDPRSIVVGDFNGDGKPDLAVANYLANTVSVMLGAGDGSFGSPTDFSVGSEPTSVATGDFNGDGKLDLAVTNFDSKTVSVLLGKGDGTFTQAPNSPYTVGNGPIAVAAADLREDSKLDLIVIDEGDNNVTILLGNGDGTFTVQPNPPTVGGNPLSVVAGDFNGDGIPDLAVADFLSQEVSVLLGNGDGSFQAAKPYPTGANPQSIVAANFNGDSKLDLAVTSTPSQGSPGNVVSLLLGNGDGTFGTPELPFQLFGTGYLSYSAVVGDFNNDGAADLAVANGGSNTVSLLLNVQGTAMTFASSGAPSSQYGSTVTLTTTVSESVSNGFGPPTGTVTFMNGSTVIGSGTLSNGEALISPADLPVGMDLLSAVYSGDSNYQKHAMSLTQVITTASTGTKLTSSGSPASPNQSITFTATVTSKTTGQPTGTVTFLDGTTTLGSSSVNGSGDATFSTSILTIGTHNITAVYGGSANFNGSTSPVLSQVVQEGNTSTALASSSNPSLMSQSVTLTATVNSGTGVMPTGTVKFMDGTIVLGSSSLNGGGVAAFSTAALSVGTHSLTAVYSGNSNSDPSTSSVLSQVVQKANTTTTLSSVPGSANLNQAVSFTAAVVPGVAGVPTGTVTFLDGSTQLGSGALSGGGVASFSTSALTAGTHSISAAYSGDSNFNVSTSTPVSLAVVAPDFSVSAGSLLPGSVAPGASATSTITIKPVGGFNPTAVALTCSVSASASPAPTCSLGAISVTNNNGASVLTVSTSGAQAALAPGLEHDSNRLAIALMIPAILVGGAGWKTPNRRKLLSLFLTCLLLGACLMEGACSNGGSKNPMTVASSGTPGGTYTITVSGSSSGLQHTTSVSLTVQ
jgi:hypothetical protein